MAQTFWSPGRPTYPVPVTSVAGGAGLLHIYASVPGQPLFLLATEKPASSGSGLLVTVYSEEDRS